MPDKAHRAASRQAQLKRRRRRGKARTQEFDQGPGDSAPRAEVAAQATEPQHEPVPEPEVAVAPLQPARRTRRRTSDDPIPVYRYLGSELRRIGMITSLIGVVLVVLTFVLR